MVTKKEEVKDLFIEIGCEEIPARFVEPFYKVFKAKLEAALLESRIPFDNSDEAYHCKVWATPRRLSFYLKEVLVTQTESEKMVMGPPLAISKDKEGNWLSPALGFSKKCGVELSDIDISIDEKGREVLSLKQKLKVDKTLTILPQLIQNLVMNLPLPIAMRWSDHERAFIRPIHWIVALFGEDVVDLELFGIKSGRMSFGHRFLSGSSDRSSMGQLIEIASPSTYIDQLEKSFVVPCKEKRQKVITDFLKTEGGIEGLDQTLLDEVTYLVEYPQPILSQIAPSFLSLPKELLIETMRKHQKYFPVLEKGQLTSRFVVVAENVRKENQSLIKKGNETVLTARLNDAAFFFKEDQKNSLDFFVPKLRGVTYKKDLGTLFDKKERIKHLSLFINKTLGLSLQDDLSKVADLCKADLVSLMVYEFPELQGVMGNYYARKTESERIAQAIEGHYKPVGATSELPRNSLGAIVGLADRIDDVVAAFYSGQIPTGSKDPLGVRRALFGIFNLLIHFLENEQTIFLDLDLHALIDESYSLFGEFKYKEQLVTFIKSRLKAFVLETQLVSRDDYDLVDATLEVHFFKPHLLFQHITSLRRLREQSGFKQVVETAIRIKRLSQSVQDLHFDSSLFQQDEEAQAFKVFESVKNEDFPNLLVLSEPFSTYFDKVLVMDKDETLKKNRLNFLASVNTLFFKVADFEKIVLLKE